MTVLGTHGPRCPLLPTHGHSGFSLEHRLSSHRMRHVLQALTHLYLSTSARAIVQCCDHRSYMAGLQFPVLCVVTYDMCTASFAHT